MQQNSLYLQIKSFTKKKEYLELDRSVVSYEAKTWTIGYKGGKLSEKYLKSGSLTECKI